MCLHYLFLIFCISKFISLNKATNLDGEMAYIRFDIQFETLTHRGDERCQQGHPSPFVPINVHSYPKLYMCTLLVSFVLGCTDFVPCFFLHHANAPTMTMMMTNYNYLSLYTFDFYKMCTLPTTVQCYTHRVHRGEIRLFLTYKYFSRFCALKSVHCVQVPCTICVHLCTTEMYGDFPGIPV